MMPSRSQNDQAPESEDVHFEPVIRLTGESRDQDQRGVGRASFQNARQAIQVCSRVKRVEGTRDRRCAPSQASRERKDSACYASRTKPLKFVQTTTSKPPQV